MKIVLLQSAEVLPPFSTSEHSLINVEVDAKPKASPDVPFLRTNFRSTKADWNNLYCGSSSFSIVKKNRAAKSGSFISEWGLSEIESFIPHEKIIPTKTK